MNHFFSAPQLKRDPLGGAPPSSISMPTLAIVAIVAVGAGIALLIRSVLSLQTSIDRDDDVVVKSYATQIEAKEAIRTLEANGIASMIRQGGYRGGIYSVIVPPDLVDDARRVLGRKPDNPRTGAA